MRASPLLLLLLAAIACVAAPSPTAAQAPPDPRIDQRIQLPQPGAGETEELEALLTGEDDILLMETRRFFALSGTAGITWTSNPALAPGAGSDDAFATAELALRFATRLGDTVDIFAEGGLSTARYFEQPGLDYVAAYGAVGAHVKLAGFDVDAAYSPVVIWDGDWERRQLTQHRFSASLGRGFRIGRAALRLQAGGERILTDPEAFQNVAATASLSAAFQLSERTTLFAAARGARRWYDDYFEGLLGVERRDWTAEASLGIAFQIHPAASIDLRLSHTRNWSTADISRYEATTGGLFIRGSLRF